MSRLRNVCWTSYNDSISITDDRVTYYIYQREQCPDTGRLHWQGYCEASTPISINGWKTIIGDPTTHIERRRGSARSASDYCKKAETRIPGSSPTEWGSISAQGTRNDLLPVVADIESGATEAEISIRYPTVYIRYPRGIGSAIALRRPQRLIDAPPQIYWFFGPPGTGKTWAATHRFGDNYYIHYGNSKWFDGYQQQHVCILDQFGLDTGEASWNMDYVLGLLDRYPIRVQYKGGSLEFNSPIIVVTSKFHPEYYFGMHAPDIRRRISQVEEFTTPYV